MAMAMEMTSEYTLTGAKEILDWPKAPHQIINGVGDDTEPTPIPKHDIQNTHAEESSQEPQPCIPEAKCIDNEVIEQPTAKNSADPPEQKTIGSKEVSELSVPTTKALAPSKQRSYLGRFLSRKHPWPNPELSIGGKCNTFGGRNCWLATGPAAELFDQIAEEINDLLDTRLEEIQKGEPLADNIISYGIYRIGRQPAAAIPTLIFTCKRPKPRRRALKFVRESEILKGRPRIALAESSSVPMISGKGYTTLLAGHFNPSTTLRSQTWVVQRDANASSTSSTSPASGNKLPAGAVIGIAVGTALFLFVLICLLSYYYLAWRGRKKEAKTYAEEKARRLEASRQLQPKPEMISHGKASLAPLSVRPMMSSPLMSSPPTSSPPMPRNGALFKPNDQDLESTGVSSAKPDLRYQPIDCTSLYGMRILSTKSRKHSTIGGIVVCHGELYGLTTCHGLLETDDAAAEDIAGSPSDDIDFAFDSDEDSANDTDLSGPNMTSQASVSSAVSVSKISSITSGMSEIAQCGTSSPRISNSYIPAQLRTTSEIDHPAEEAAEFSELNVRNTNTSNDWALIKMSDISVLNARDAWMKNSSLTTLALPTRCAPRPKKDTRIVTFKNSAVGKGILFSSSNMMKLQPSTNFQEVWTVMLEDPLVKGDSGSWVIDQVTGDLYGHIVAGVPDTGVAFIIPAVYTFPTIEKLMGPVQFLSDALARQMRSHVTRLRQINASQLQAESQGLQS